MRIVAGSMLFLGFVAPALAVPSYTEKLYVDMKAATEPDRPSTRKLTFVISGTQGEPAQWEARQVRKTLPDGKRTLTVFLEPESVKGIALLTWERTDKPSMDFLYLAPVRRVSKNPDLEGLAVLYSEFTFADIGVLRLGDRQLTLLGAEEHAGKRTMKVQEVPRVPRPYVRVVTWFATESSLPIEREFYDIADSLVKTEQFEFTTVDDVPVPTRIRIENKVDGGNTTMQVSDVRGDIDIPDSLFDPSRLAQVANAPFWQVLATSPTPGPPPPPAPPPPAPAPSAPPPAAK
jgi:Outer membrane lipoprotein-sorting protein